LAKEKPNDVERVYGRRSSLHRNRGAKMEKRAVLLIDADADTASSVLEAVSLTSLNVRFARTSRDFFQLIQAGLDDVAVIVLDVDPGVHGMAVLEALEAWGPAPPVIVISSLEEARLRPVALAHGAKECFGKPVSTERLKRAIVKFTRTPEADAFQCDVWGHPYKDCTKRPRAIAERELAFFAEEY
jgi:DNA-binding NtrC family response regulator